MPKGRSKKSSNKAKPDSKARAAAKPKGGVRKQIRRLERELATAAAVELKRVRKLERAHHRLQRAEAALDELRGTSVPEPAVKKSAAAPKPAATAAKPAAPKPAPAKPAAPKPIAAKPATAAAKPTTARVRQPSAAKPAAPKPAPAPKAASATPATPEEPKA